MIWSFLAACAALGIACGIAASYWPFRPVVYPMGHPVYFLRGGPLLGYYRQDEKKRIRLFLFGIASASLALVMVIASLAEIVS